ncbi:MAG: hypothetical protein IJ014_03800 [Rikenellaceae bacterium]|nr:hypothetical protein [Rikenellaceae bacterium]
MAVNPIITSIEAKVARIIEDNRKLRGECEALTAQRDKLRAENRALQQRVTALDKELSHAKLNAALAGDKSDKRAAKARINRLMREVDSCIAMLTAEQH